MLTDIQGLQNRIEALENAAHTLHWMARRYADGRSSYATGLFNDITRRLLSWGINLDNPDGTPWARDSHGPVYSGLSEEEYNLGKPLGEWLKDAHSEEYAQLRQVNQILMKLAAVHYQEECDSCTAGQPCGHLALLSELQKIGQSAPPSSPPLLRCLLKATLTSADFETFLSGCKNTTERVIVLIFRSAGLRLYELLRLKVGDIDLQKGTVTVKDPSRQVDRVIPLAESVIQELDYYFDLTADSFDGILDPKLPLFFTGDGKPFKDTLIKQMFRRISRDTGVQATPYTLRRAWLTEQPNGEAHHVY